MKILFLVILFMGLVTGCASNGPYEDNGGYERTSPRNEGHRH
jgi:hypothetical protein